jgi:predicted regulator of Ras-like GTPase activity (Roadblock/LC7/MglB family)
MEEQTLAALRRLQGVATAYVVDGGGVRESTTEGERAEVQGALLAALLAALGQATRDMELGDLGETIVETERGSIVAGALAGGRTAVVVTHPKANLGMIRVELRRLRRAG